MKWLKLLIVPFVLLLALTACGKKVTPAAEQSASAKAHAVATSSAGTVGKEIVAKCVPQNGVAQAKWFRYMAAGKHSKDALKGTQTREAFAACAGIPPTKMSAFETQAGNDAVAAAKSALSPNVTIKQATENYLETTLPEDVVKFRG